MIRRRNPGLLVGLLIGLLLVSFVPATAQQESPEALFQGGNEAYEQGLYDQAVEAYRKVLTYRVKDARLEYNLGNAEFRRGNRGLAILHFERARRLAPTDEDVLANLAFVRDQLVDGPIEPAAQGWVRNLVWSQDRIGPDRQAWMALVLVWALVGVLSWAFAHSRRFRPIYGWVATALILVLVLVGVSWYTTWLRLEKPSAVVLVQAVDLLAGPGGPNNPTLTTIHEGLMLDILEIRAEWVRVGLPNGFRGWVPRGAVEPV